MLELILAMAVFAVVLAAINGVFYGAIRLRNKTTRMLEASVPLQQALTILRRDLAGLIPPGGTFGIDFKTDLAGTVATWGQPVGPAFRTTSGRLEETAPWGEVQNVAYYLRQPTNRLEAGLDLVRVITRNLLPELQEDPVEQWLMRGVERMEFSFYDGTSWRTSWDSTVETTVLPKAIKVQLVLAENDPAMLEERRDLRGAHSPIELVVPVTVAANTNQTQTATTQP